MTGTSTLTQERIVDLAPSENFSLIDRYLPDPYRRALSRPDDPMAALTRAGRAALRRALNELEAVQRSRALAFFNDLTDGGLLGALHDQSPWPEDDVESFRARLTAVAALAMRGAATAERMLALVALAGNGAPLRSGALAAPIAPATAYDATLTTRDADGNTQSQQITGTTGPGQTRQYMEKPSSAGLFAVDVIDAPLRRYESEITPLPGPDFRFALTNPASATLPGLDGTDPVLWPDPVFTITAGARRFGPFAFVRTGTAQVLVVNRVLEPGAVLHVDAARMVWETDTPGTSALARLTCRGDEKALYAGFGLSANDHLIAPPVPVSPTGPLLTLRTKAEVTFTGALADAPPLDATALAAVPLEMPSLLGDGQSQWRVVEISSNTEVHEAQFTPLASDTDVKFSAHWFGRRPGEFCVATPDTALAPDFGGPLPHRRLWLDAMVERFKLAGTVRISQDLLFSEDDLIQGTAEFILRDRLAPTDALDVDLPAELRSELRLTDSMTLLPQEEVALASTTLPADSIEVRSTEATLDGLTSPARPVDAITFAEGLPPSLTSATRPIDTITVTEGLPGSFVTPVQPTDTIVVLPQVPLSLRSSAFPTDRIEMVAQRGPVVDGPVLPTPGPIIVDGPVTPTPGPIIFDGPVPPTPEPVSPTPTTRRRSLTLRETTTPTDTIRIRRTRR